MGFNFNPTLWFVCRFCRHSFASTETLKEHKLACHLGECVGIKSIVFEERLLDTEWKPESDFCQNRNQITNENENRNLLQEGTNDVQIEYDFGECGESSFQNPFVSLTRLTEDKINLSLNQTSYSNNCERKSNVETNSLPRPSCSNSDSANIRECELAKQVLHRADQSDDDNGSEKDDTNNFSAPRPSNVNDDNNFENGIEVKQEFTIYGSSTPTNSVYSVDEDNEVPQIHLASNLFSTSDHENQFFQQEQEENLTFSNDDLDSVTATATAIAQSEYQETFKNESNNLNLNVRNMEIKIKNDSELLDTDATVETEESELQLTESIQHQLQQSDSLPNSESTTATDQAVTTPFMCETCFAFFRSKITLRRHKLCHSSVKAFKCSKCPSEFKRSGDLARHQIVHGEETDHKCRFCSKSFSHKRNLLEHERTHTGDRPFKCPVANCKYAASKSSNLKAHSRAWHSEELGLQQFLCPTCGKAYGTRCNLGVHIRNQHGGSKLLSVPTTDEL